MLRRKIEAAVKEVLISLGAPDAEFVVERPGSMTHGDYATNAALAAAKFLKRNPREVATQMVEDLEAKNLIEVKKIEAAGAGFINFFITGEALATIVDEAAYGEDWANNALYEGKVVMVEYTQPNPFKPFHIGHLMSNTLGEAITHVLEHSGAEVIRANYQGDVGPHVAKALYILLRDEVTEPTIEQIGDSYVEGNKLYEENPEDKVAIDTLNKKIYSREDTQVNALYDYGRKLSLKHFEELYNILGTKFDFYFFESETGPMGQKIVEAHPEIFEYSDGALVFKGENYGLHTRVFVTSQHLPTYEAKEVGLAELKQEKAEFDLSITVTASEQNGFFAVVFKAIELLFSDLSDKLIHRSHGMMRFASGKMSSRKGNVVTGESLLMDLTDAAKEKMQDRNLANADEIAQQIAVGAIKYTVLKQGSAKDIIFDPEKSLSLEGDSGPYLQYAHTRALSLIEAAKKEGIEASSVDAPAEPTELERLLPHFADVLKRAALELEPHHVTTYLTELASAFNSWYASTRVIDGPYPQFGLLLAESTESVLKQGLEVLGIPVPEKM